MPSPIAHSAVGLSVFLLLRPRFAAHDPVRPSRSVLLGVMLFLSLLPDLDAAVGLLLGNLGRYHNNLTHSLLVGIGVSIPIGALVAWVLRLRFAWGFFLVLFFYEVHILMDFLTIGRGVMVLWPVTGERFESPAKLFYGLRWSDGLVSARHLWTLLSELGFAVVLLLCVRVLRASPERAGRRA